MLPLEEVMHFGSNALNLYQVRDRRWQTVSESIPF